jgi:hypothetical protein
VPGEHSAEVLAAQPDQGRHRDPEAEGQCPGAAEEHARTDEDRHQPDEGGDVGPVAGQGLADGPIHGRHQPGLAEPAVGDLGGGHPGGVVGGFHLQQGRPDPHHHPGQPPHFEPDSGAARSPGR